MKRWKTVLVKVVAGYFVNTVVVGLIGLLLHYKFKLDAYDVMLICGAGVLLYSFMTYKRFVRTLPAVSPLGGDSSGIGDQAAHAAILNTVVADFENRNRGAENNLIAQSAKGVKYILLNRSSMELISYGILLVIIGLIKYYSYF